MDGTTTEQIPLWLQVARSLKGTHEGVGPANNPVILGWAQRLGGWTAKYYTADAIPWCGLFVGYCFERSAIRSLPENLLGAVNWATWGVALPKPVVGCVLVFIRPGGHHVAFYEGEDDACYHVTGGNQSDAVSTVRILKAHCMAIRWPESVHPYGPQVQLAANGEPVSTNQA